MKMNVDFNLILYLKISLFCNFEKKPDYDCF